MTAMTDGIRYCSRDDDDDDESSFSAVFSEKNKEEKKREGGIKKKRSHPVLPIRAASVRVCVPRSLSPSAPRAHLGITVLPDVSARNSRYTRRLAASEKETNKKKLENSDKPLSALAD